MAAPHCGEGIGTEVVRVRLLSFFSFKPASLLMSNLALMGSQQYRVQVSEFSATE